MIPTVFTSPARPVIEVRGLGEDGAIKSTLLKELQFCSVREVENFGMLEGKGKSETLVDTKRLHISENWFAKYNACVSSCWLEFFHFSPLESIDLEIAEDISVGSKFAASKNKRYLPVIICPDQSAFATRLSQIRTASKSNPHVCEGSLDPTTLSL